MNARCSNAEHQATKKKAVSEWSVRIATLGTSSLKYFGDTVVDTIDSSGRPL